MENNPTSPATHGAEFLRVLPFYLQQIDPEEQPLLPVALWRHPDPGCEGGGDTRCDDTEGLQYTIAGDEVTTFCPRHWYEGVFGPHAPYRLIDMTDEQYRAERAIHKRRLLKDWEIVAGRLKSSAAILSSCGLTKESGKLWEAYGWVRSSIRGK